MYRYKVKFPLDESIAIKALECAHKIKAVEKKAEHAADLIITINHLVNAGLTYFFIRPVEEGNFGFVIRNMVYVTIKATAKSATTLVPRVVKTLDNNQLEYLADFILDILESYETKI